MRLPQPIMLEIICTPSDSSKTLKKVFEEAGKLTTLEMMGVVPSVPDQLEDCFDLLYDRAPAPVCITAPAQWYRCHKHRLERFAAVRPLVSNSEDSKTLVAAGVTDRNRVIPVIQGPLSIVRRESARLAAVGFSIQNLDPEEGSNAVEHLAMLRELATFIEKTGIRFIGDLPLMVQVTPRYGGLCPATRLSLALCSDGTVVTCRKHPRHLGRWDTNGGVLAVWNHPRMDKCAEHLPTACSRCAEREICAGGCLARKTMEGRDRLCLMGATRERRCES